MNWTASLLDNGVGTTSTTVSYTTQEIAVATIEMTAVVGDTTVNLSCPFPVQVGDPDL